MGPFRGADPRCRFRAAGVELCAGDGLDDCGHADCPTHNKTPWYIRGLRMFVKM
ncbi:hypothetical protein BN931_1407 [Bifidobacterium animalis subsp. lactis CECT 8145]|nr:hypothetical protein W91_0204 [Bifidobacterium animalis subsp. lactis Bi-07]QIR80234.1 hypothetical protein M8PIadj_0208 [Bifidobacterium animalis]CDL72178.1 hypothetical protein BN931_1407 [Bifidobacterium animalis subsp. lactis CECT 8145]